MNKFMFKNLEDYQNVIQAITNDAFNMGWNMARTLSNEEGIIPLATDEDLKEFENE